MRQAGMQSFLRVIGMCWRRPSLIATEVAWRWAFGLPALALVYYECARIYAVASPALHDLGLANLSLDTLVADPTQAGTAFAAAKAILLPMLLHAALGLAPLIIFVWAVISGFGRAAVLRKYDFTLQWRPWTLAVFQFVSLVALIVSLWFWYAATQWSAAYALKGGEPNIVLYLALVICLSLGIFFLRSLLSWVFLVAPLVAILERRSGASSFRRSLQMGQLKGKMVEVNLVMGLIKLALVVLATVFSATPLPFASVMQGAPLWLWWVFVTLLYLVASDFFQLARMFAFIEFWREANPSKPLRR